MTKNNSKQKLSLLLLREALWEVEDKIKLMVEAQADHEADLIRLKHFLSNILNQLQEINSLIKAKRRSSK